MSDNVRLTDHDKVLAADEIGNVKHLKVKMQYGGNDTAIDVSETTPLPVTAGAAGIPISLGDSSTIDAFGRMRVSNPNYVFDNQNQYGVNTLIFNAVNSGSADVISLYNESAINMTVTAAAGDKAVRQTKKYFRYQPAKSHTILMSHVLGSAVNGVRKRLGYFDGKNGIYLEQIYPASGAVTGVRFVIRSYAGGSVSENAIDQKNWNLDTFDGNGPSGINLDVTKAQILFMDLEWLGVGRVRCGFVVNGKIYYCHQFNHANVISTVYTTTANLPLRVEIENVSGSSVGSSLKIICSSIFSEGGYDRLGYPFAKGSNASLVPVSTRRPVFSVKPKLTFNTVENRMDFDITGIEVTASLYSAYYEIVYNGTLTNANFADVDSTYSGMQYDITANAISGGVVIAAGYAIAGGPGANATGGVVQKLVKMPLGLSIDGSTADQLTIVATCTDVTKTANVGAVVSWQEIR